MKLNNKITALCIEALKEQGFNQTVSENIMKSINEAIEKNVKVVKGNLTIVKRDSLDKGLKYNILNKDSVVTKDGKTISSVKNILANYHGDKNNNKWTDSLPKEIKDKVISSIKQLHDEGILKIGNRFIKVIK